MFRCVHVQKYWPWQEKFDKFLTMLFAFGFSYKWQIEYLSNFVVVDLGETKESGTQSTPLTLEHFYSGFAIYAFGLLCGILVFLLKEKFAHKQNNIVSKKETHNYMG